jgi:hypothetical protein
LDLRTRCGHKAFDQVMVLRSKDLILLVKPA